MKIKTLGTIALLALALKGCPSGCFKGDGFEAGKVNSFETLPASYVQGQAVPTVETIPGYLKCREYFREDINGDGAYDAVCIYEGGNVFYAKGKKVEEKVTYNRVMPKSNEAKNLQKSHPNLEILAGD